MAGPMFLLVLPGALYFALNRFDVLPTLLVAMSLACLGRRWWAASAVFLALATLVKVYPVLLAPLVFRYLMNERRTVAMWTAAYLATLALGFVPPLLAWGWDASWAPYRFQLGRPPEYGWTFFGGVVPWSWAANSPPASRIRLGIVLLVGLVLFWQRPADLAGLLRRGAIVLVVFVSLQVFYSPQWLLWFSPLLVPLASSRVSVGLLVVAIDLVTYLSFPVVYDWSDAATRDVYRVWLVGARAVLLAGLLVLLIAQERATMKTHRLRFSDNPLEDR